MLLNELPPQIANAIHANDTLHVHVLNIINTCASYPNGFEALFDALGLFDKDTKQFRTLVGMVRSKSRVSKST